MTGYTAFVLTESSRLDLLDMYPPLFDSVIAHHVTYEFNVDGDTATTVGEDNVIKVIGTNTNYDVGIQVLVVSVDGTSVRPDNATYHITLSIDSRRGASQKDSNGVIRGGWTMSIPSKPFDANFKFIPHK